MQLSWWLSTCTSSSSTSKQHGSVYCSLAPNFDDKNSELRLLQSITYIFFHNLYKKFTHLGVMYVRLQVVSLFVQEGIADQKNVAAHVKEVCYLLFHTKLSLMHMTCKGHEDLNFWPLKGLLFVHDQKFVFIVLVRVLEYCLAFSVELHEVTVLVKL